MESRERDIIATDDLGRPVFGPWILREMKIEFTAEPAAGAPHVMQRRNPGLAFASSVMLLKT